VYIHLVVSYCCEIKQRFFVQLLVILVCTFAGSFAWSLMDLQSNCRYLLDNAFICVFSSVLRHCFARIMRLRPMQRSNTTRLRPV